MVIFFWFIFITAIIFQVTCMSVVYSKADKPSWVCIVPIYGIILLCDIAGKPRWWTLLCVIPLVNLVACVALSIGIARNFEKSDAFGVGLALLPVVFYAILAFGDSDYDTYDQPERTVPVRRASSASPATRPQQKVTSSASPMTRPQQRVTPTSDAARQRPRLARCPACRSTTFHVVEEAGSRRCDNCHSVLPNYIQGNECAAGQSRLTGPV